MFGCLGLGLVLRRGQCPQDAEREDPGGVDADLPLYLQQRLRLDLYRKLVVSVKFS